jgi:tRNA pseudouridine38-40 synthase
LAERNIRLDIQYKGTDFAGWQFQPDDRTIQGEIEKAITRVTGKEVTLYAAGRTDAGVHALGQVANFRIDHTLPPERYKDAINYYLPDTILITNSILVPDDFHARKSALWRQYKYLIGLERTPLYYDLRWEHKCDPDLEKLNATADYLRGRYDFSAFCVVSSLKKKNDCDVHFCCWQREESLLTFEIRANRFLHSMVRSLVGVMIDIGCSNENLTLSDFQDILLSKDHTRIKHVAPARGLYMVAVGY